MAAHPFGPIENQLIVGYYKRGKTPSELKPTFLFKKVLVETELHHPVNGTLKPVFYGWSPANGNSSSHDFQVKCSLKLGHVDQMLYSRGLGYRITFTMPDNPLSLNNTSASLTPMCQLCIVDIFGEAVLSECNVIIDANQGWGKQLLESLVPGYQTLEIEVTPLHIKIVENSTAEQVLTTFQPVEGPPVARTLDACGKFGYLLSGARDPTYCGGGYDIGFMDHFRSMIAFLHRSHRHMEAATKTRIREHVMMLVRAFSEGCLLQTKDRKTEDAGSLAYKEYSVLDLDHRLARWFDGLGEYPTILDPEFVTSIYDRVKASTAFNYFALDFLGDEADNYFARAILEHSKSILTFQFLNFDPISWILYRAILCSRCQKESQNDEGVPVLHRLRQFTLEHDCQIVSPKVFSCKKISEPGRLEFNLELGRNSKLHGKADDFEVIPGTDLLLGHPTHKTPGYFYTLVDVAATYENHQRNRKSVVTRRIAGPPCSQIRSYSSATSSKGIIFLSTPLEKGKVTLILEYHSFAKRGCRWATLKLDSILEVSYLRILLGSVMQARKSNLIFGFIQETDKPKFSLFGDTKSPEGKPDRLHFICCKYDPQRNTVRLMHHNTLGWKAPEKDYEDFWIESDRLAFSCIFSCTTPTVWVVVNWKKRFVPVGSRSVSSLIPPIDLSKQFSELIPLMGLCSVVGVAGLSRPERTIEGHDSYRVGRLRFRL